MDVAAKTVELLSQRILPEKPHQLSFSADWRYRQPAEDDPRSKRFEEWHNTRLQYLTFVTESDRGVLLTRSYYDMREEPAKPVPREVSALSKGAGPEKKKLSLSDYKNKKTGAVSASPPEPAIAKRKESERISDTAPTSAAATPDDTRSARDSMKRQQPTEARKSERPKARDHIVDMSLPPKPPSKHSLPPRPPSPNSKKRTADLDDEMRPQKRSKPELGRSSDGRPSSNPRDDAMRRKERHAFSRDSMSSRDDRGVPNSSLSNGRAAMKATDSHRNVSPLSRPKGDSMNGAPRTAATDNRKGTPSKLDTTSKTSVPPLLSPLHLSFDGQSRRREEERGIKGERRKRDEAEDPRSPTKPKKKGSDSPVFLPPLLSPTLPPDVEAALSRAQKESSDSQDDAESGAGKKQLSAGSGDDESRKPRRAQFMVTIRIPKRLRQTVKRILNLNSGQQSRRDGPDPYDFSDDAAAPPSTKKRPAATAEKGLDVVASKRPRALETSKAAPSTPSKKGTTAMSRVSSSNSAAAHTPGDAVGSTPVASGSTDRRSNGLDLQKSDRSDVNVMIDKETRFGKLGKHLKHEADLDLGRVRGQRDLNAKRGFVLSLESFIAFMLSFHTGNTHRSMCGKRGDPSGWASMFPLMEVIQKEMRRHEPTRFRPLYALLLLLHVVSIDELRKCYGTMDNSAPNISFQDFMRYERTRAKLVPLIREANDSIESLGLRADASFLSTLEEILESALRILRRWCADENVDWTPEVTIKELTGKHGTR